MPELNRAILAFAKKYGRIPGENLSDLRDALIAEKLVAWGDADEKLRDALGELLKGGLLALHVRKGEFLHLLPVS